MSVKRLPSGRWQTDVRTASGQRLRRSFRTENAAKRQEREWIDQREQGILPTHGHGTLAEFLPEWEKTVSRKRRANTQDGYDGVVKRRILPELGDMKLRKIDVRVVQRWVNNLEDEGLGARTVEFNFAVLSTILTLAASYGLCEPVRRAGRGRVGVHLPKKTRSRRTPPTVVQIERLCDLVDPRFGAAGIRVAGYCGLRQSEIFGLHPSAVDFDRHRIAVRRTVEHSTGAVVDLTKNGKDRIVTMTPIVEEALREQMRNYGDPDFVFHMNGRRFDSSHFHRDIWQPALRAADMQGTWFHDLRHSAASIMINAGWPPNRVQRELGHHSAGFTMDVYSHLWNEDDDQARIGLNDILGRAIEAAKTKESDEART